MNGHYILCDEKTVKTKQARTIKLVPDQLKWGATLIEEIEPTPYDEHVGHHQEVAFQDRPSKPGGGDAARKAIRGRRMHLKGEDFKAFAYTIG